MNSPITRRFASVFSAMAVAVTTAGLLSAGAGVHAAWADEAEGAELPAPVVATGPVVTMGAQGEGAQSATAQSGGAQGEAAEPSTEMALTAAADFADPADADMQAAAGAPTKDKPQMGVYFDSVCSDGNAWAHNYARWSNPSHSFLHVNAAGDLERVELVENVLVVEGVAADMRGPAWRLLVDPETYTPSNQVKGNTVLWGGYFGSADGSNWVVTGQVNEAESDSLVVVRVTKYDADWAYVAHREFKGANTYIPFEAGGCSITEEGGLLYIRTCHEMYDHGDGLHHQANMQFVLDESDLSVIKNAAEVANQASWGGYVSHSFAQYQTVLGGYVYGLDHGDAYPRAVTVKMIGVGGDYADLVAIPGGVGENTTGVSVGGFEASETTGNLIAAGNAVDFSGFNFSSYDMGATPRNIWVATMDGALSTKPVYRQITAYKANSTVGADTPFLVKVSDDRFLLLWGELDTGSTWYGNKHTGKIHYLFLDGNGQPTGSGIPWEAEAMLSDCQPAVHNGKVVWYAADYDDQPTYYTIDASTGAFAKHQPVQGSAKRAGFTDLNYADWYMSWDGGAFPRATTLYLDYTVDRGLMSGKSKTTFDPTGQLTRAEAAMVLFRLANPGVENGTDANKTGLPDVKSGMWYTRAVNWCFANGVVTGYTDANDKPYAFGPDDPVTRAQLATMIARYCNEQGQMAYVGTDVSMFSDAKNVGKWAYQGMAFCNAKGIMTGYSKTTLFGVNDRATRCQMAKIIAVAAFMLDQSAKAAG